MKTKWILLFLGGIILFYVLDSVLIISYADEYVQITQKKTYEELEKELQSYKNVHMLEAGFRTIDIIFGWNHVFSAVGNFCDSIINVLDSYYLWTPLKWIVIINVSILIGYIIAMKLGHVADLSSLAERAIHDLNEGAGLGVCIKDKDEFIESVLTSANFEKGVFIEDLTGKVGDLQFWKPIK